MKSGRLLPDLLATLGHAASPEASFARALKQLVSISGATAGGLCFTPGRGGPLLITAGLRRGSALDTWFRARLAEPAHGPLLRPVSDPPPGWRGRPPVLMRASLGERGASLGRLLLLGQAGRRGLRLGDIPPGFPRELGLAMDCVSARSGSR
jgi:hypothetical protein